MIQREIINNIEIIHNGFDDTSYEYIAKLCNHYIHNPAELSIEFEEKRDIYFSNDNIVKELIRYNILKMTIKDFKFFDEPIVDKVLFDFLTIEK